MRYLLAITLLLVPFSLDAAQLDASRFDWSLGTPAITADNTTTCNNAATARFDWSLGQPVIVHDNTATCTVAAGTTVEPHDVIRGTMIINTGSVILQ